MEHHREVITKFDEGETLAIDLRQRVKKSKLKTLYSRIHLKFPPKKRRVTSGKLNGPSLGFPLKVPKILE